MPDFLSPQLFLKLLSFFCYPQGEGGLDSPPAPHSHFVPPPAAEMTSFMDVFNALFGDTVAALCADVCHRRPGLTNDVLLPLSRGQWTPMVRSGPPFPPNSERQRNHSDTSILRQSDGLQPMISPTAQCHEFLKVWKTTGRESTDTPTVASQSPCGHPPLVEPPPPPAGDFHPWTSNSRARGWEDPSAHLPAPPPQRGPRLERFRALLEAYVRDLRQRLETRRDHACAALAQEMVCGGGG